MTRCRALRPSAWCHRRRPPPPARPTTTTSPCPSLPLPLQAAISFEAAPPEALAAGGAVILLALAGIGYAASQQSSTAAPAVAAKAPLPREDAVLVFGATGRMGRVLVSSVGG